MQTSLEATNQPPQITLTNPLEGRRYIWPSIVKLEAQASDPDGQVARVEFFEGTNLVGTATNSPYEAWMTFFFDLGPHTVFARAIDDMEASTDSSNVYFYVSMTYQPYAVILAPEDEAIYMSGSEVVFSVTVDWANDRGTSVDFLVDEAVVATDSEIPYSIVLTNLSVGQHTLKVRATNSFYEVDTSDPITITIMQVSLRRPEFREDRQFAFDIEGLIPGLLTVVEATTDFLRWDPIATNLAGDTRLPFLDPDAALHDRRFYRAVVRSPP